MEQESKSFREKMDATYRATAAVCANCIRFTPHFNTRATGDCKCGDGPTMLVVAWGKCDMYESKGM